MNEPIDAMRCYCGAWVSVPHVECIANYGPPVQGEP